jgi:hypothetical protein
MRANLTQKRCINCELTKPRLANFSKSPNQPDFFSPQCRQCKEEIKGGERKPVTHNQQRRDSSGSGGLLLDAVWRGYADWREVATARQRWCSDVRNVQPQGEVLHTLGTPAPQTAWRTACPAASLLKNSSRSPTVLRGHNTGKLKRWAELDGCANSSVKARSPASAAT